MKLFVQITTLALLAFVCEKTIGQARPREEQTSEKTALALAILDDAIAKQEKLIRKFAGSPESEASLRIKLAETLQRKASLLAKSSAEIKLYQRVLRQQIFASRWLITHCADNHSCPQAYLYRGLAHKNLSLLKEAKADFQYAVEHFPEEKGISQVISQLAQMELDAGEYRAAINHYLSLKGKIDSGEESVVLEKLSWAYAGENDFAQALAITQDNLVRTRKVRLPKLTTSLLALNTAIFYVRALENNRTDFSGAKAVDYFEQNLAAEEFSVAARAFPSLFTKEALVSELEDFAYRLFERHPEMPASADVMQALLDKQVSLRRISRLALTLEKLVQNHEKAHPTSLGNTIRKLDKNLLSFIAEKDTPSDKRTEAVEALRIAYQLASFYFESDSEAALQFQFNLGTLEYSQKNYSLAEKHLRAALAGPSFPRLASLRTQAVRQLIDLGYRQLKESIPLSNESDESIALRIAHWDELIHSTPKKLRNVSEIESMHYEVARLLYENKRSELALPLLKTVIETHQKSSEREDAVKLVSALYIEQKAWAKLWDLSQKSMQRKDLSREFNVTLKKLQEQAIYGQTELAYQNREYRKVVDLVQRFGSLTLASRTGGLVYSMGAKAAMEQKVPELAMTFLDEGLKRDPSPEMKERQILLKANLAEEKWDYQSALNEYLKYFSLSAKASPLSSGERLLRERVELLAILVGSPDLLQIAGHHPRLCSKDFAARCGRLKSFAVFLKKELPLSPKAQDYVATASRMRRKGEKATVSDLERLLLLLRRSSKNDVAESYLAVSLLSALGPELRSVFLGERAHLKKDFSLEKDISLLPKRLAQVKRLENLTQRCSEGTSNEFASLARSEMSGVYLDLKEELDRLMASAKPGTEYADQLRQMSKRLAERVQGDERGAVPSRKLSGLTVFSRQSEASKFLQESILEALRSHRFGLVNYLVRVGKEKKSLSEEEAQAVESVMRELIAKGPEGDLS